MLMMIYAPKDDLRKYSPGAKEILNSNMLIK